MAVLSEVLAGKIDAWRSQLAVLRQDAGDKVVSEVTLAQILGGMRGAKALLCDTSYVDPQAGLRIRDVPVAQLADRGPEEIFFLLCCGELPDAADADVLKADLGARCSLPDHVWQILQAAPENASLMSLMSIAVLALQAGSSFDHQVGCGMKKQDLWRPMLEDSLDLIAKLPTLAAGLYRTRVLKEDPIAPEGQLDQAARFVHMLGGPFATPELTDVIRALILVQCDHEGGNVCNLTCQIVNSVHSDPFYAFSAGINGLAGPLHGLASQHMLQFILHVRTSLGTAMTETSLRDFILEKLSRGEIIPGFGHAVLRSVDPRFTILHQLGRRFCRNDELFQLADRIYHIVPEILKKQGRVAMPYPNVDAISGPLLYHFGLTRYPFYTVVFAMSMALGMCAQMIINRALMMPIFRPRSVTTEELLRLASKSVD